MPWVEPSCMFQQMSTRIWPALDPPRALNPNFLVELRTSELQCGLSLTRLPSHDLRQDTCTRHCLSLAQSSKFQQWHGRYAESLVPTVLLKAYATWLPIATASLAMMTPFQNRIQQLNCQWTYRSRPADLDFLFPLPPQAFQQHWAVNSFQLYPKLQFGM